MEPPPQPMRPETIGRAAARASAAMASARQVRMRMWRSFFLPRDSRGLEQELHRRPLDRLVAAAVDQVDRDGHGGRREEPEQEW
jgi:hypothetical protein